MTTRRGRDEGSIYRRKDGRWVAQYTTGDKRRYIYGKTRKVVAAKLAKAIADRDRKNRAQSIAFINMPAGARPRQCYRRLLRVRRGRPPPRLCLRRAAF
jgi:hypothetical protein